MELVADPPVLVNLITNAIKFTRLEQTRKVCVSLGIAHERPTHSFSGKVPFSRTSESSEAETLQADWEKGDIVGQHAMGRSFLT